MLTMQQFLEIIHDGKVFSYTCHKRSGGEIRTFVGRVDVAKHVKGIGLNYDPLKKNLLMMYCNDVQDYRQANLDAPLNLKLHGKEYKWDGKVWQEI